jgi:hypothetical protein
MAPRLQRLSLRLAVLAIMLGLPHSTFAQEATYAPCITNAGTWQPFSATIRYALGGILFMRTKGLFLARTVTGNVSIDPVNTPDDYTGLPFATHDIAGGALIRGYQRLFLARVVNGAIAVACRQRRHGIDTQFQRPFGRQSADTGSKRAVSCAGRQRQGRR